ncbi:MAG: GMC family oxidoreductase [bacterium]|nr:GMC family oxidoreductase [bacterium]
MLRQIQQLFPNPTPKFVEDFLLNLESSNDPETKKQAFGLRKLYLSLAYPDSEAAQIAQIQLPVKKRYKPDVLRPQNVLKIEGEEIKFKTGEVDFLIIGSGPAGCVMAHELSEKKPNAKILLVDSGSFLTPGSIDASLDSDFIESHNRRTTVSGGIVLRNAQAIGGGSTVNIDLAFSPLLPQVKEKLSHWIDQGALPKDFFHEKSEDWSKLKEAYGWVTKKLGTRHVKQEEINQNNQLLLSGTPTAKTYDLNQKPFEKENAFLKNSAVDTLLLPALEKSQGNLALFPEGRALKINFEKNAAGQVATSVLLQIQPAVNKNEVVTRFHGLKVIPGETYKISAKNIILSAGTLGSAAILLNSKIKNDHIGRGIVIHPSQAIVGLFKNEINCHQGLSASVYATSKNSKDGYYFESMGDVPSFLALIHPGSGQEVFHLVKNFKHVGGFGAMLIDSPYPQNRVQLNQETGAVEVAYLLTEQDKKRYRQALIEGVRILFDQGAESVFVPSRELVTKGESAVFYATGRLEEVLGKLEFKESLNFITSAHMQGSNKLASTGEKGVVSPNFKVFDGETDREIPNLYVIDSSVFPTSVGANPMQAIYTLAKLAADRAFETP